MLGIAYLCFLLYVLVSVLRNRRDFLALGAGSSQHLTLTLAVGACAIPAILSFSGLPFAVLLRAPIPFVLAAYVPAIVVGRRLTVQFERSGTDRTRGLESISQNAMWVGIVGGLLDLIAWVLAVASHEVSKVI